MRVGSVAVYPGTSRFSSSFWISMDLIVAERAPRTRLRAPVICTGSAGECFDRISGHPS